jgi:hypothetical protein
MEGVTHRQGRFSRSVVVGNSYSTACTQSLDLLKCVYPSDFIGTELVGMLHAYVGLRS